MKGQQHPTARSQTASSRLLRGLLQTQGYVIFRASELGYRETLSTAQRALIEMAKAFPPDPYSKHANRFRGLGHAVYIPEGNHLVFLPPSVDSETGQEYTAYIQGEENPEHKNQIRRFAPIPRKLQCNPALRELVKRDFQVTPFADLKDKPYAVTFHVIRHVVTPGEKAASSPDLIHTDDVLLSFVHVLERNNVVGGVNCIAKVANSGKHWHAVAIEDVLVQATVVNPFDGYAFIDDQVSHYVSPIEVAPGQKEGARTVLIIDFAPLRAVRDLNTTPQMAA